VRRWLRRILEALGVAALSLLVAEAALRLVLDVQPLTPGQFLFEHHPTRGWTHRPSAEDLFVKIAVRQSIRTNSAGLREREIPYDRTPGRRRILCLGDSTVVGFEVAEEDRFTRVAERVLRESGRDVEILNAGFRGYGTDQILLFLREEGLRYRPDVVVYFWSTNDPEDNMTIHRPFRMFGKGWFDFAADGTLVLRGTPVPEFDHDVNLKVGDDGEPFEIEVPTLQWAALWARDLTMTRSSVATAVANIAIMMPAVWQQARGVAAYKDYQPPVERERRVYRLTAALVRELERSAREAGAEFRVVGGEDAWAKALFPDVGIEPLPLARQLERTDEPVIVPFDSHMNQLGHRLYGEAFAKVLLDAGLAGGEPAR
jgi:lysophospholipase L1-like esterase